MSWLRQVAKLRHLFRGNQDAADLQEEIRVHLLMEEQDCLDSGMPAEEAQFAARKHFGNITLAQERSKDMWTWQTVETLGQDIRFGIRQLRQNLGFTTVAVLTFALGIGATTAVFSVVNAVLIRPLPFQDSEKLVNFAVTETAPGSYPLNGADYLDWQRDNRTFAGTSVYEYPDTANASGADEPETVDVMRTQANFFDVLGVRPIRGRPFQSGEDTAGKNKVAVLSYAFWQRHLGGSDFRGKNILLNNQSYAVVGVMPPAFLFRFPVAVWVPMDIDSLKKTPRGNHWLLGFGRLKQGATLSSARADLLAISQRLEKQYPDSNAKEHAILTPLKEVLTGDWEKPLKFLLGAVTLVLLVACFNVANLQVARASTRYREMAVRSSLGAGRFRLLRQLLTESVLLALAGAAVGVGVAWWGVRLLQAAKSVSIPRENAVQVDGTVLLFAVALSVVAGVLFGLAPALQSSERKLNAELRAGTQSVVSVGQSRQILRDCLVVAEISITLALLVAAGLLLRSFVSLRNANIGINPERLITTTINLPDMPYMDLKARRQFFDRLLARMSATPGIENAAISTEIPLRGGNNGYIRVDGNSDHSLDNQLVGWNCVTPGYFRTMGIRLLAGRALATDDVERTATSAQRVFELYKAAEGKDLKIPADVSYAAVISQTMAHTFWRNQNAVGRVFHWNDQAVLVIGVVNDVREYGIRGDRLPQAYLPLTLNLAYGGFGRLTVKTRLSMAATTATIRKQLKSLDPTLAPNEPETMRDVINSDTHDVSLQAYLLGVFAILTLMLAAVGLYGVMSYLVTQRTREIGIRMALGAERASVLYLIMKHGATLTLIGMLLGAGAAFGLTRAIQSQLYGVESTDPLTFAAVAVLLAVVALAAYFIPARRATKIDPVLALRYE